MNEIKIFKLFSDKSRIRLFHLLSTAKKDLCFCEIKYSLAVKQYNLSKYLRELKINGFIKERREGVYKIYKYTPPGDKFRKKIIDAILLLSKYNFVTDDNRLKKIISLRKKKFPEFNVCKKILNKK